MKLFAIVGSTTLLLIIFINLFVMLVMYIAEDYHVPDYVHIYELFESQRYLKIRDQLMKHNYTILIGDDESGVKNFIEHQANIRAAQGMPVVVKRYKSISKHKRNILKKIKETRFYMQLVLGIGRKERTEVFFIKSIEELPIEEIKFIKQKYPNDNIIVVSEINIDAKIPAFKKIVFPGVTLKELKKSIQLYYHLSSKQALRIFEKNYRSVERVFDYFKRKSKYEGELDDELIEVDDIQDLNEISHEMVQKEVLKLQKKEEIENKNAKKSKKR